MARPEALVSIGGGSRVSQTYSGIAGSALGECCSWACRSRSASSSRSSSCGSSADPSPGGCRDKASRRRSSGVRVGTITLSLLVGLWAIGFRFTDLLVGTAVFSAVIGIILAPLVGNFINGVFILADQPFEIGDMIELENGTTGFVEDITIRYTKIFTLDNTFLVVPNGTMRERDVTNYSAEDERTRRTIEVLVTYESDVSEARRLIERAARDCDAVIDGGPDIRVGVARYVASPDCRLHEFGDDGVLLRLRYWVKKPYKLAKVQSDVNTRIRERVTDADVEMAYPHRHLVFDDTSGIARVGGPESGRPAGERAGDKPGSEGRGGNGISGRSRGSNTDRQ